MQPRPERLLDHREYPVLYVDADGGSRAQLERVLSNEFQLVGAAGAKEALRVLQTRPIALVLAEQSLPGTTGTELLARVGELDARALRVLVTAEGDAGTLGRAIHRGALHGFVAKPFEMDEMRLVLRQQIERYALDGEREDLLRELTILHRTSHVLHRNLEVERLVDLLLETLTAELRFDGAALFLFSAAGDRLRLERSAPLAADLAGFGIACAEAPVFLARVRSGQTQALDGDAAAALEEPVRRWVTRVAAREILGVPLMGRQGAVGLLAVDNRRRGRRFHGGDRTLLEGLAALAGVALENARLVEDLRRSREQVVRADQLGRLGTLAAGLAHEINNPLVSIRTFLCLAPERRQQEDPAFWQDYHAVALRDLDRIRALVEAMDRLSLETDTAAPREPCDPNEIARSVARLVADRAARANVRVELELGDLTPKVLAVRGHLHQVLLNLLLNAIHATTVGGRVRLRTGPDCEEGEPGAFLEVCDTGRGIPEEDLERIFDPFFTTKGPDQGIGLGLMICHQLVELHGGRIQVRSRVGEGTRVCVQLRSSPR